MNPISEDFSEAQEKYRIPISFLFESLVGSNCDLTHCIISCGIIYSAAKGSFLFARINEQAAINGYQRRYALRMLGELRRC